MDLPSPSATVFHAIESTIKEYRKFSQKKLSNAVSDMTIDQGLVLAFLDRYPEMSQKEIAALAFKDNASMTRMINLMVKKEYLERSINKLNRRRYKLEITPKGKNVLKTLTPIVLDNREKALEGVTEEELIQLEATLKKIKSNCNKP
ncbi:MarR family transcriptional regulator [Leptobacterium flavescens]|uniref:MarR family transcriptional regulator n=1 Tax=Leptobacterium flavescens TaxID=472055 RepID=A0A6P0UR32_9FLAO|nr:MarR family transcriptional regulator [Leptobacterium flavescens]NER14992.1 MarR family transcriptional regulator [Leptobacterium flavescens]